MKRLLSILLAALFVVLLTGCQTSTGEPFFKTYYVTGSTAVDEEVDQFVSESQLKVTVDGREEEGFAVSGVLALPGAEPVNAVIAWNGQGLYFALPGLDGRVWHMGPELLQGFVNAYAAPVGAGVAAGQDAASEEAMELLAKYAQILSGLFQADNMTASEESFRLELLDATADCTVMRLQPSAADWQRVLEELCTTALADEQLAGMLKEYAGAAYAQAGAEYDADELMDELNTALQEVLENAGETAEELAQFTVEIASDGDRVYAVRLIDDQGTAAGYESFGELSDERKDAVVFRTEEYGDITLVNTVKSVDGSIVGDLDLGMFGVAQYTFGLTASGRIGFDIRINAMGQLVTVKLDDAGDDALLNVAYNSFFGRGEVNVLVTDGEETVALPEGELVEIESEEQLEAVLDELGSVIGSVFAPAA